MKDLASQVRVEAWADPVVEALGFDPRGPYLEFVLLGRLGPSACWCLRRLVAGLAAQPGGYECSIPQLGAELGLGQGTGRNSHLAKTLARLEAMGLVREAGPGTLQVRRALAPVTQAQLARLAPSARRAHDLLVDRRDRESGAANNKDRAEVASARCREATRDLVRGGSFER